MDHTDKTRPTPPGTREGWLDHMVAALRPIFVEVGYPLPEKIRVTCGFPGTHGLAVKRRAIGEAWAPDCSADGTHETFISPLLANPVEVAETLVHELVHHAVGTD